MMIITAKQALTSRALDALITATNAKVRDHDSKYNKFWLGGKVYNNRGDVCRQLISDCNEWLIPNGLVDLDVIRNATDSTKQYNIFEVN